MPGGVIGQATIEVGADASDVGNQIEKQAGGSTAEKVGSKIAKGLGVGLAAGAAVAGAGVALVLGTAITAGFARLTAIDDAKGKLQGLGFTGEQVAEVMKSALASVKGTAFGLGDAATIAANLLAAGVPAGQELTGVLKSVADAASIAGVDLQDMSDIFADVAAKGKVSGDIINRLADRGVPALQFLAKHFGITQQEAAKMVSEGKVDFAAFKAAMDENIGGAALSSGTTFSGGVANIRAALSRLGASLLDPAFQGFKSLIQPTIGVIDGLTAAVAPLAATLSDRLAPAFATAAEAIGKIDFAKIGLGFWALWDAIKRGDVTSDGFVGVMETIGDAIHTVWTAFQPAVDAAIEFGKAFVDAGIPLGPFGLLLDAITPILPTLVGLLSTVATILLDALAPVLPIIGDLFAQLAGILGGVLAAALPVVVNLITTLAGLIPILLPAIVSLIPSVLILAQTFADLLVAVLPLLPTVLSLATSVLPPLVSLIQTLAPLLPVLTAGFIAYTVATRVASAVTTAVTAATTAITVAMNLYRAGLLKATIQQWLMNAALLANPIGLIIAGVAALVAALVLFFTKTEVGKKVWAQFSAAIGVAWDAIVGFFESAVDVIKGVFEWFANFPENITALWEGLVAWFAALPGKILGALGAFASQLGTWIKQAIGQLLIWTIEAIAAYIIFWLELPGKIIAAVTEFGPKILQWITDAWTAMVNWLVAAVTAYITFWVELPGRIIDAITTFGPMVLEWIVNAWNAVDAAIDTAVAATIAWFTELPGKIIAAVSSLAGQVAAWITDVFWTLVRVSDTAEAAVISFFRELPGKVITAVSTLATKVGTWIGEVFASMRSGASTGFENVRSFFTDLPQKIIDALTSLPGRMLSMGTDIINGLKNGLKSFDPVAYVRGLADSMISKVKSIFGVGSPSKVYDSIGSDVGQGWINGLDSMARGAQDAMANLVGPIPNVVTAPGGANTPGASASAAAVGVGRPAGTTVINLTVPLNDLAQMKDLQTFLDMLRVRTRMGVTTTDGSVRSR